MKKKIVMALLACMISSSLILTSCGQNAKTVTTSDKSTEKKNSFSEDDIKDVITGLEDHYILQDAADIDYLYGVTYDTDIVKKVKADSDEVKLNKTGTYTVTYTVTVDQTALEDYLEEKAEKEKESADTKSEEKNADDKKNAETDTNDTTDSKGDSKKEDSGSEEESEKSEDKTEEKEDSESDSKQDDKKEDSKESEKSDSDSKKEEESKKDDTVDVKVDKDMTVVDKDQAKDLADKDEVVWGDKNTPVEKSDGSEVKEEEKVPESVGSKSDSTSNTKTDSKKEESKKNETGSASTSTGNTGSSSSTAGSGNSGSSSGGQAQQPAKPPHTHKFVPHYTTTTKQTGQEWVPNLVQVGSKTVCNGCGADITGHIEHSFECGNGGYHSEPIYDDQGWYEPVYSEVQVVDYYYCSSCGQRK